MSWGRIRGHNSVVQQFRDAAARDRLAHAYLLVGPPGVGKRLFALELAKALLCEKPTGPLEACDRCAACKLVAAGNHPDFSVIRKPEDKQEFPIDTMRDFLHTFGLKPSRGSRKIAFVEDAEDFNEESANAFLKTLEEPPADSLLLLRATSIETQLATILSRCQPVRFAPLADADVRDVLAEQGVDAAKVERLAKLARGSVGRALALNDPALGDFRRMMVECLAAARFNAAAFAERWVKFVEESGRESSAQRARASLMLHLFIDLLRQALRLSLGGDAEEQSLRAFAERVGADRLVAALDAVLTADRHVEQRLPVPVALELLADKLAAA